MNMILVIVCIYSWVVFVQNSFTELCSTLPTGDVRPQDQWDDLPRKAKCRVWSQQECWGREGTVAWTDCWFKKG